MDSAVRKLVSQDPAQLPKSKAFALLDALEVRDFAGTTSGAASAHPVAASVVLPDPLRRDVGDVEMSVSEVKTIMKQLTVLRTLDERSTALSVATNFAYWKLGVSYQAFADRRRADMGSSLHPRTEQKLLFDMLCNEFDFQLASKDLTTQWNLKKRLQRSRKFLLLVKTFGENILHAVPEVSVTRLDPVKFEDLQKLATGSVEASKVKRILARMTS